MKNEQGNVNAENIGGTYDREHELNKKLSKHTIKPSTDPVLPVAEVEKNEDDSKMSGVNAENVGGTAVEERPKG